MVTLGLFIKKNEIRYAVLCGNNKEDCIINYINKLNFRSELANEELMNVFESEFLELINKYHPEKIIYKLSLKMDKDQIPYMYFSLGVLNLICYKNRIKTVSRTSAWITSGKNKKLLECIDFFKSKGIIIKNTEKEAILLAWNELGERVKILDKLLRWEEQKNAQKSEAEYGKIQKAI